MFLVLPSAYFIIYLENMPSIWAKFNHIFEVFQGHIFAFLLISKKCARDEVGGSTWPKVLVTTLVIQMNYHPAKYGHHEHFTVMVET